MAVDATNNVRNKLHRMGTGGSYYKLQGKQAICCAMMKLDDHGNLSNRKLFKAVLPHENDKCRKKWVDQCVSCLKDYNDGKSDALFNEYEGLQRDS